MVLDVMKIYCLKCKGHQLIPKGDTEQVEMKNGRTGHRATCPECGAKVFGIGK